MMEPVKKEVAMFPIEPAQIISSWVGEVWKHEISGVDWERIVDTAAKFNGHIHFRSGGKIYLGSRLLISVLTASDADGSPSASTGATSRNIAREMAIRLACQAGKPVCLDVVGSEKSENLKITVDGLGATATIDVHGITVVKNAHSLADPYYANPSWS